MAKATRNNNTTTKEETKMAKYIVEAPEPKKGQKVSSGGIRENGKLASQFKNPVPYKEQARARRNEAGMYLLGLAWQEFGEPLLRSSLRKLGIRSSIKLNVLPSSPHRTLFHRILSLLM